MTTAETRVQLVSVAGPPRPPAGEPGEGGAAALSEIVTDVFDRAGATWDAPGKLPPQWPASEFADRAARALADAQHDPVVWQDPRGAFAWRWLATVADVSVVVVVPDPAAVTEQLCQALDVSADRAVKLWFDYLGAAQAAPALRVVGAVGAVATAPVESPAAARVRDAIVAVARPFAAERHAGGTPAGAASLAVAARDVAAASGVAAYRAVVAELAALTQARDRAEATGTQLAALARAEAEARARADARNAELAQLHAQVAQLENTWIPAARAATARERELDRAQQQLRRQLRDVTDAYQQLRDDYLRLRSRRSVQVALSAAAAAKPLVARARGLRPAGRTGTTPVPASADLPTGRVFTIVLNYRSVDDTLRCVDALAASEARDQRVVVVDNGSGGDEVGRLRADLLPRTVLDAGDNLGYAAGNNLGIRYALERDADYLWILNPDAEVEPDTLTRLLRTMEDNPDAGIVGGRLLNAHSSPTTIASDGGIVDWAQHGASDHLHVGARDQDVAAGDPYDVDFVSGSCMLVRRAVFDVVGLLPEEWFLYFEETSFNLAVAEAGWRILVQPQARVWHAKRSSGRLPMPTYVYYFVRNRLLFARRHAEDFDGSVPPDLHAWIDAWRDKVAGADPHWLATFEQLVGWALADADAEVAGRRRDVEDVPLPGDRRD